MHTPELQSLIQLLARLPGLGPRSGRRAALYLIKHRDSLLPTLIQALSTVSQQLITCSICGNLDTQDPCLMCEDKRRDDSQLCLVETISDLWALERAGTFQGRYHILGGALSIHQGITPHHLSLIQLETRLSSGTIKEVILAFSATPDGLTTTHYLIDWLKPYQVSVTGIAHGVPLGGELDYLDEGTLQAALHARRQYTF